MTENLSSIMYSMMFMNNGNNESVTTKMIFSVLVIIITSFFNELIKTIKFDIIQDRIKYFFKTNTSLEIKAVISYKNNIIADYDISLLYKAVMFNIYEKISKENPTNLKYHIRIDNCQSMDVKFVIFTNPNTIYTLTDKIAIKHNNTVNSTKSDKDYSSEEFNLSIIALDNCISSINEFIETIVDDYDNRQVQSLKKIKIFSLSEFHNTMIEYNEITTRINKTFDNMFFDKKKELVDIINNFCYGDKDRFNRLGLPETLGLLLHGEPGTGKTSAIKAIANLSNRHIILVPVKKITSVEKLRRIFLDERINLNKIPMNRRLYVFEELDCSQWKDIVVAREFQKKDIKDPMNSMSSINDIKDCIVSAIASTSASPLEKSKGSKLHSNTIETIKETIELTLGEILETLDGMIEMPERMIIFTTNHPEILDPALLRPGRIDVCLEFTKMSKKNVTDMYQLWFDKPIPNNILERMHDYKFTQAEIGNLFSTYNQEKILNTLAH